jgi:hypothetical protein
MSKKILLTATACLAMIVALATAAYALVGPISALDVTPPSSTSTISGTSSSVSFTIPSAPTTVTCTVNSLNGTATPGSLTSYATISALSLGSCGSWVISNTCTITIDADTGQNVNDAPPASNPDTTVTGRAYPSSSTCLKFQQGPCIFTVLGNVAATFNETLDVAKTQGLTLSGSGFSVSNPSAGCFGLYSGPIGTSAAFRVNSALAAPLNFVP